MVDELHVRSKMIVFMWENRDYLSITEREQKEGDTVTTFHDKKNTLRIETVFTKKTREAVKKSSKPLEAAYWEQIEKIVKRIVTHEI